jgi:hypothetical protein
LNPDEGGLVVVAIRKLGQLFDPQLAHRFIRLDTAAKRVPAKGFGAKSKKGRFPSSPGEGLWREEEGIAKEER